MAGKCGFDGDFSRFKVADLADHDDIGVLTQEAAERSREVQTDFVMHLHLVDTIEVVLNRIFCGGDIVGSLIQLGEGGVEGGRLAGTGGASDQDHAVGLVDGFFEVPQDFFLQSPVWSCLIGG